MSERITTSVEMPEVAEPAEETGVEVQEVAEPESTVEGKTEEDAAWARMRREKEATQSELEATKKALAELQAANEARESTISRLTGKGEDAEIAALAEVTGMSEDEIKAEIEAASESAKKDIRIEQLEEAVSSIEAERLMQADLEKLRKIDPSLRSLDDLGDEFAGYIAAGLSPERAYWALKAEERATMATPPKEIGRVETGTAEKDYFTDAEIDAMSSEELTKNYKKILASWERRT